MSKLNQCLQAQPDLPENMAPISENHIVLGKIIVEYQ